MTARSGRSIGRVAVLPLLLAALTIGGLLVGCGPGSSGGTGATASGGSGTDPLTGLLSDAAADQAIAAASPGSALAALGTVAVKGRAPRTGYTREQFGQAWADVDHNGCDTRNDILARDLTGADFKPGTHDCIVLSGTLHDPYSGRTIEFRRGPDTSEAVQIDHVVALSDAWQTGAQGWTVAKRTDFANDPRNLLAVDGPLNQQKSDGDAATWLPPDKAYRCPYVARQVAVKAEYGLWTTRAERDAIATVLSGCPGQPLPAGASVPTAVAAPPSGAPPSAAGTTVHYDNCAEVRAAGAAPIHRGDPGWQDKFDSDGDGVGCE